MTLKRIVEAVPLSLVGLRLLLVPLVLFATIYKPEPFLLGSCLVVAFISDIFDGILARRLKVVTPTLRRFDSTTDTLFYLTVAFAVWHLHPTVIIQRLIPLGLLLGLELIRHIVDFAKFRREASYHMWSSKLWGIVLFAGFFCVLALGSPEVMFSIAIYAGFVSDLEGLAISLTLPEWKSDVPTLFHARQIRRAQSN